MTEKVHWAFGFQARPPTRRIAWGDRKALLRDEEREQRLAEHEQSRGDKALQDAVDAVPTATGEPGGGYHEFEIQRILDRAGVEMAPADLHPLAFTDRHGVTHLPLEALAAVAQAFAAAEPQTVIGYLDDEEQELRLRGNQPGDRWYHQYQRELSPGYALARQWAGLQEEAEMLRKEIARLRGLLSTAAYELKAAGQEHKARRLLRALEGR